MEKVVPNAPKPHTNDDFSMRRSSHSQHAPERFLWRDSLLRPRTLPVCSHLETTWYGACKMAIEWLIAVVLLLFALPIIFLAGLVVKLTSRGAMFYTQTRVGKHGKLFTIYKIRTMVSNCESKSGAQWATTNDPRITRVGSFLRKTHIDELPQLLNVLRCDMSLVGPRPERPEFIPALEQAIPGYRNRLRVRPGVTGIAQVQLPADTDMASVRRKLAYDLYYIRNAGLWLDLRLMLCTGIHMFGVPYRVVGIMFGLPGQDEVESVYAAQIQPAPALVAVAV
jgi:lipopolysaccharide/colanic/teichoic acid biosynthesis glycosyltransferase